jgi:RNA recognition motif-containing protein
MATKDPEQPAPEEQQPDASSKKRKSALDEIQVDLSLPEPPSKKARRALKKGKTLPAKPTSDDEDDEKTGEDGKADGGKDDKKKKKERSPYGVWIGNLRFTVTKAELRQWLVDNSGGSITDDDITRVHMPTTKPAAAGPGPKKPSENRGFAYVDFATLAANVAAIALSETEWHRRKLLIKDSKSFEGRPKKEEPAPVAADGTITGKGADAPGAAGGGSTKVFVGNMSFNTTEDDLYAHFEKCGKIRWIKVATFEDSGKCKGYGWVNFEDAEAAAWAVKGFVKVRETVETLEDFMDVDGKSKPAADGEEVEADDDAPKDTKEDSDDDDEDDESSPKKKTKKPTTTPKEPARIRTRKWWVNQLLGRTLKIELAEDDQTRYNKRFRGKGGAARRQQDQDGNSNPREQQQQQGSRRDNNGGEERQQDNNRKEKKAIKYETDINVARLTGAPVAHQGKKVTFD